jgi:cytochrome c-type biogenesis protein CcmE
MEISNSSIFEKRRLVILLLSALIILGSMWFFANRVFSHSTVYYTTIDEVLNEPHQYYGDRFRVNGRLLAGSFDRQDGNTTATFILQNESSSLELKGRYTGIVPELFFNEHSEIVAEGIYHTDGVFHADNIIVKCPSKYVSEESKNT